MARTSHFRHVATFAAAFILLMAFLVAAPSTPASAADSGQGQITGLATSAKSGKGAKNIRVELWNSAGTLVKATKTDTSGFYWLGGVTKGSYTLKFIDQRKAWNTSKFSVREVKVKVSQTENPVNRDVSLKRGAYITGIAKGKTKKALKNARVQAVNQYGGLYETTADKKGRFAVAGLTAGSYTLFVYDASGKYAAKTYSVGKLKLGKTKHMPVRLTKKAGRIVGVLSVNGTRAKKPVWATAVNTKTGQYWVQKISKGKITFKGLSAGKYRITIPDVEGYRGKTVRTRTVKSGKSISASVNLTKKVAQ